MTSPTVSPVAGSRMGAWPRAGGPRDSSPTLRRATPPRSCAAITSAPGKPPRARLVLGMSHARAASTGVVASSMSLPYRHSPASSLARSSLSLLQVTSCGLT